MGFDAIWISPVVKNTPGGYHGYWAMDLYDVNENFGSKQDLKDLITAAQSMGIWVMIDVVANHMGTPSSQGDYSGYNPFNQSSHYHNYCNISDWNNQWQVENCWLANLPDLSQENNYVQQQLFTWITWLQKEYNVDGFRIDTVPEVPKWFWTQFNQAAGTYCVGECFNGNPAYVGGYQGPLNGLLNYPMYFTINDVWAYGKSAYEIRSRWNDLNANFSDIDALGMFVDNHDNERFLHKNGNWKRF
jgi:alpha-amylase